MTKIDLEHAAAKCFTDFSNYWKKMNAFREDFLFFKLYMKRNSKSDIMFTPAVYSKSFQYVLNSYSQDEEGLAKAFNIFHIMKQLILDFQEWNTPIYSVEERNNLLRYLIKYEYVDVDIFCRDFISCSRSFPEIKQEILEIAESE